MDKNLLITRLSKALPGVVLEIRRFGRSAASSIWVETHAIQKVAEVLKQDPEGRLDWLENFSVVEFENVFVMTYFIRSSVTQHSVVVRISAIPPSPNAEIILPSIRQVWPMGEAMEQDSAELFGIIFKDEPKPENDRLPDGWLGFPLRKNYVFPKEFMGIAHFRSYSPEYNEKKSTP